jgi:hypothetical protein
MRRSRGGRELGQVSRGSGAPTTQCVVMLGLPWVGVLETRGGIDVSHGSMSGFKQGAKLKDRAVDGPASSLE